MKPTRSLLLASLLALASSSLASAQSADLNLDDFDDYAPLAISDPIEGFNRAMFKFNDGFYYVVGRPISKGYQAVLPEPAREGVSNFISNLLFPVRFVGCVLQGKVDRATRETGRFLVNSTVGVAGFMDASTHFPALHDIPKEDVGQAFASWGIGHGPYLVLPFLGPSSTRDFIARFGDRAATPWNWTWLSFYEWEWSTALQATEVVSGLRGQLRTYDLSVSSAPDPYVSVRTGYIQFRNFEAAR